MSSFVIRHFIVALVVGAAFGYYFARLSLEQTLVSSTTPSSSSSSCSSPQQLPAAAECICPPPPPFDPPPLLGDIFQEKGTDKSHRHGYQRFYDILFRDMRDKPITLLEIGADHGASINSWSAYFTNKDTRIFGLAFGVTPSKHAHDPRVQILYGDQNNCTTLADVAAKIGTTIDIIIDDGSHHPDHQLRSFLALFPLLPAGGVYTIEDVETSYWDAPGASIYGYGLEGVGIGKPLSIVERAKLFIEVLNQRYMTKDYKQDYAFYSPKVDPLIETITFAQNIIYFRKKVSRAFDVALGNGADGQSLKAFLETPLVQQIISISQKSLCP